MPATKYRLYFDNAPATREQLDSVEDITVQQEIDIAWEARLRIPVVVDDKGHWKGENEQFMKPFSPVRVEVKAGEGHFVPLIDGPIVNHEGDKSPEPGRSFITLVVRDDSVYLNRKVNVERYENRSDDQIADQLFGGVPRIPARDIESAAPRIGEPILVQRGTAIQILRLLAYGQGMHAYVLPGDEPGRSVGCFKRFSAGPSDLPPLVLLGKDRNLEEFNVTNDAESPSRFQASFLNALDKQGVTTRSNFEDIDLLGPEQAFDSEVDTALHIARPGPWSPVSPDRRAGAEAERASYAFEATGSVLSSCYPAVLRPYNVVSVRAINDRLSGDYRIKAVTHSLTRSRYAQSFTFMRNARSGGSSNGLSDLIGAIF